jgi:hypothetical protein
MLILTAMLLGMGLYFLYDGQFGYPKSNAIAARKHWFENELLKGYDDARAAGKLDIWTAEAAAKGWPTGADGQPPRWISWAAQQGYPEDPKQWTEAEIQQQFWFGWGSIFAAAVVGLVILINRGKKVIASQDHWITAGGKKIRYADVFRLDLRKWPHKGLAYAWFREQPDGPEQRAPLDDLKFSNMQLVLDRLRAQFKGELIEKVEEPATEEAAEPEKKDTQ